MTNDPIRTARDTQAQALTDCQADIKNAKALIATEKGRLTDLLTREASLSGQVKHLNAALGEGKAPRADTGTKRGKRATPAQPAETNPTSEEAPTDGQAT